MEWWIYKNCGECKHFRYLEMGHGVCVFEEQHEYVATTEVCKDFIEAISYEVVEDRLIKKASTENPQ